MHTRPRAAFTLIEVMVTLAVIALLIAILVPAIGRVRSRARAAQCKANLRQFYLGFQGFADRDFKERFSTGAVWAYRGCIDTKGWIADLVNTGACHPQDLLCPSSLARASIVVDSYLSMSDFVREGSCRQFGGGGAAATPAEIADHLLARGYGSNYGTSFYFDSTMPNVVTSDGVLKTGTKSLGPLQRRTLDRSPHSSGVVPFVADMHAEDKLSFGYQHLILTSDLANSYGEPFAQAGARLAHTGFGNHVVGADVEAVLAYEQPGKGQVPSGAAPVVLDTAQISPLHAGGANVLMGDGSVQVLQDVDGDGQIDFTGAEMFSGLFVESMSR